MPSASSKDHGSQVLARKVALVTGGGSGIGRATALRLAREGARVVVVGRRLGRLNGTARVARAAGGDCRALAADVSTASGARDAVATCVRSFGRLDILVNNAGVFTVGSVAELSPGTWRRSMASNLDSVFLVSRYALRHLRKRGGVIVNVSSTLGSRALPRAAAYNAAKAAVENLTRAMAVDHARERIRVVAVAPGIVATAMGLRGERGRSKKVQAKIAALHPWGRLGRPEDVASLIVHLCRPESDWITGSIHTVDGGLTAKG